jgi:hypothetical protein
MAAMLGDEDTKEIVSLFLESFPKTFDSLRGGTTEHQMRVVHGLKSSTMHMGAAEMSELMGVLEDRLSKGNWTLTEENLQSIHAAFEAIAPGLRRYVGP